MRRKSWFAAVIILAAVGAGVGAYLISSTGDPGKGPTAPIADSPCPTDRSAHEVRNPSRYTEEAPAYAGPGPHRIQVVAVSYSATGEGEANEVQNSHEVPGGWESYQGARDAPLVLCRYLTEGELVQNCAYYHEVGPAGTTTLVRATFTYHLYEAKAARLLKQFQVAGTEGCPNALPTVGGVLPKTIPQWVDQDEVAKAIQPFVEASP